MIRGMSLAWCAVACITAPAVWSAPAAPASPPPSTAELHLLPVQGNIYMLVGAGGNITLQIGDSGVLLVDTQYAALSDKIVAAIRKQAGL